MDIPITHDVTTSAHPEAFNPRNGFGDWNGFDIPLASIYEAAAEWKKQVADVEKLWLCWNVSPRWCELQQRLVKHVGWTPVIGFDPRVGPPPILPGSILIDFNANFRLPVMLPHFPLEFMFLWSNRLAFWHSDLLCRLVVIEELAEKFEALEDGQMAAVLDRGGRRNWLNRKRHRFFELIGCTTRAASENQYYNGCGWFRNFAMHPNCTLFKERRRREGLFFEHGAGIMYWKRRYHGPVLSIPMHLVNEGHCTDWNSRSPRRAQKGGGDPKHSSDLLRNHHIRDVGLSLDEEYSIDDVAIRLGIAHLT